MTIEEIKELLRIFNESGVGELEWQRGKDVLRVRRAVSGVPASAPVGLPEAPAIQTPPAQAPPADTSKDLLVKSPIVGTFYEARSPGGAALVKVGDAVEPGQVLCIIESMKLMNEIEAEFPGVVEAKLVMNGQPVEYGEALFSIRPL